MKVLFIFRRDFRINDNIGLNECSSDTVYPIFIFTPEQIDHNKYKSDNCVQFMVESLIDLNNVINITFCHGLIEDVIKDIVKKNNIEKICANTDYTPYAIKRDKMISKLAQELNIEFKYYHDILLLPSFEKDGGGVYQKFTPFYNKAIKIDVLKPTTLKIKFSKPKTSYEINMTTINRFYKTNPHINIHGGREKALAILKKINNFSDYNDTRNSLHINTTQLSAYLKFGCISIRECFYHMRKHFKINNPLIRQLYWREFYYHLYKLGTFGQSLKPKYDNIIWENDTVKFNSWCNGKTGYPIIDSCMTQLNTTGYMHNRGRLIVASFLIKNLHVDWRKGEKYFAQNLLDYDPLVNQGNWQWVAGCGADSMPYFRVFNPWIQSNKFDKDCIYIKHWLPNLKDVDNKHIHQWDKYNESYNLKEISYYKPIVDYSKSKKEGLVLYKKYL